MTSLDAARSVMRTLVEEGVEWIVHAPGARNLPLLAAAQELPMVGGMSCVDERAAAFLAVGWMRGRALAGHKSCALVLCTSGTAALNLLPATAEARESGLPLVVLTADRPAEEIGRGANQTVDQVGPFAPLALEQLPLPCAHQLDGETVRSEVGKALRRARQLGGPLHINLPFAEPLLPATWRAESGPSSIQSRPMEGRTTHPLREDERHCWDALEAGAPRGLVWMCDAPHAVDRQAARRISRLLGWPLLADGGSGLCMQGEGDPPLLKDGEDLAPLLAGCGAVLQLGKRPVSRRVGEILRGRPGLVVDAHPGIQDGFGAGWKRWQRTPREVVELLERGELALPAGEADWLEACRAGARQVGRLQAQVLGPANSFGEAMVARRLMASLPEEFGLLAGNSLPIRLVDQWRPPLEHDLRVAANRGLSGIDGLVATALGFQQGLGRPAALLVGDLSLLHDLGSLAMVAENQPPLLIVVINNGGGGIFRLQRDAAPHAWARHEHQVELAPVALALGMEARLVATAADLQDGLDSFVDKPRPLLLECRVPGDDHPRRHAELNARLLEEPAPSVPPLRRLWLHGFLGAPEDWLATRLKMGTDSVQDEFLQLPGHGQWQDSLPQRPDQWVDWLLDQLPVDGAVELVGYSMGGRLALAAALRAPQRVSRLVLAGANPGLEREAQRRARSQVDEEWARLLEEQGLSAFLKVWYAQPLFAPLLEKLDFHRLLERRALGDARLLAQVLRSMSPARQENFWPRLQELSMPVLWIAGTRDSAYAAVVRRGASRTPHGQCALLAGVGHALPLEAPEELAALMVEERRHWTSSPGGHDE